ncbi:MAG: ribosome silencing factor [Clostridia bacterium]
MESKELANKICKVLSDKKAKDIISIHVSDMTIVTDYFVIASGQSPSQVKGLYGYVDEELSKIGIEPKRFDGVTDAKWIAIDYGDVIVHIFLEETREFYHLDNLWDNGTNVEKFIE